MRKFQSANFVAYLILGTTCLLLYLPTVGFDFLLWDDPLHILKNPFFAEPFFTSLAHLWTRFYFHLYIPVAYTVWDVVARVSLGVAGGLDPRFFHALNVLTHAANACLVYVFLRRLRMSPLASLLAAALFAIHPVQSAAVAWVAGFKDLGATTLSLISLLFWLRRPVTRKSQWLSLLAYTGALLTKPSAIVVPLVAACLNFWAPREERVSWRAPLVGLLLGTVIACICKILQPDSLLSFVPSVWDRFFIALESLRFYVFRLGDFVSLSPEPGRTPQFILTRPAHWGILVPPMISIWFFAQRKKNPDPWRAWVVFVVSLLPVLGFIPFGRQEISTVAVDYLYFPMVAVGWLAASVWTRMPRRRYAVGGGVALVLLAGVTLRHLGTWKNSVTFFSAVARENPNDSVAYNGLGAYALDHGDLPAAYENFSKAVSLKSDLMGISNLATTLQMQGRVDEMEALVAPSLEKILEAPQAFEASEMAREPIIKMAVLQAFANIQRKEWSRAETFLRLAVRFGPRKAGVFYDLGQVQQAQKARARAAESYGRACALEPRNPVFRAKCQ